MEKLVQLAIDNKAQQKPKEFYGLLKTLEEMSSNKIAVEIETMQVSSILIGC